jgi:hypothetical protein
MMLICILPSNPFAGGAARGGRTGGAADRGRGGRGGRGAPRDSGEQGGLDSEIGLSGGKQFLL